MRSPAIAVLFALILASYAAVPASAYLGRVGGRTEVKNVKENAEVQALGRFSVDEYKKQQRGVGEARSMEFKEVLEAEKQVVAGIKYYLKVAATQHGEKKTFDSVVVVVPWERKKQLVKFAPSARA